MGIFPATWRIFFPMFVVAITVGFGLGGFAVVVTIVTCDQ